MGDGDTVVSGEQVAPIDIGIGIGIGTDCLAQLAGGVETLRLGQNMLH